MPRRMPPILRARARNAALRLKTVCVFAPTAARPFPSGSDVNGADNSIDWLLGPKGSMVRASAAAAETGTAITDPLWNMTYYSDDSSTDDILLETAGNVGRVTQDISSPVRIGTVTFTVAPGAHAAVQNGAPADGDLS